MYIPVTKGALTLMPVMWLSGRWSYHIGHITTVCTANVLKGKYDQLNVKLKVIPYIHDDLWQFLKNILWHFTKYAFIDSCELGYDQIKIVVHKRGSKVQYDKIDIELEENGCLCKSRRKNQVAGNKIRIFKIFFLVFMSFAAGKLFELCPLGYVVVRCSTCDIPNLIARFSQEPSVGKWRKFFCHVLNLNNI